MGASECGQTEVARVLMEHGASVAIKDNVRIIDMILNRVSALTWLCSVYRMVGRLFGGLAIMITQRLRRF